LHDFDGGLFGREVLTGARDHVNDGDDVCLFHFDTF
jgi:hypothetical protein